tara:strand:+ start:2037 stop:2831 length:795 start_codon:yes stop_codon:yes gene_type:complete
MESLNILISNDDGIFSDGIKSLARKALERGHKVTVVCPDQERSATGHGLTLQNPIRIENADALFEKGITAWGCSGTPADCVKLALSELLDKKPDLVLSGVNQGPNLGTDIFCSGTVAAAMEGTLENIPSMAISLASFKCRNFEFASEVALKIAEQALKSTWPKSLLLNLNIPPCEANEIIGGSWTRLSIRKYKNQFSKREDPRGNEYYWLAGEAVLDLNSKGYGPKNWPSDVSQIQKNKLSLTPIEPDLFWRDNLDMLPDIQLL